MRIITFKQYLKQKGFTEYDLVEQYGTKLLNEKYDEYCNKYGIKNSLLNN